MPACLYCGRLTRRMRTCSAPRCVEQGQYLEALDQMSIRRNHQNNQRQGGRNDEQARKATDGK